MTPRSLLFVALLLGACAHAAHADEIVLWNGDRLSGRITHLAADTLEMETGYAGAIEIRWNDVASVATDDRVDVMLLGDYVETNARLIPVRDGFVGLEGVSDQVPLYQIAYINPTPDEVNGVVDYSGHINLSAAQTRGNTSNDQKSGNADLTARARHYRFTIGGRFNHAKERLEETTSNWLLNGNYDWFIEKKKFLYLRGSAERDRFKDAHSRQTRGTGYGVQLVEDKQTNVSLRGGLDYVALKHIDSSQQELLDNPSYLALGWGVKASHKFGRGNELFHEHDGFWNLDDREQVTVRSRTGLRVPLFMGINASLHVNADWENKALPGRKKTDTTAGLGLGYAW